MEVNFSFWRLFSLAAFFGCFFFFGGFSVPEGVPLPSGRDPALRGWLYSVLLFLGGAMLASCVDHFVGDVAPTNLRPVYIVLGVVMMGIGCFGVHAIHTSAH